MRLRELVEAVIAIGGVRHFDVHECVTTDAVRYQLYLKVFAAAGPDRERELFSLVRKDPDGALVEATITCFIDQRARTLVTREAFDAWAAGRCDLMKPAGFCVRRIAEWQLYKDISADVEFDEKELVNSSDWLQRKVAGGGVGNRSWRHALEALATAGRTKCIRKNAQHALGNLRAAS